MLYSCPRCGNDLDPKADRIHRRFYEKLINLFVQVRRFRCGYCEWQGLLRYRYLIEPEPMKAVPSRRRLNAKDVEKPAQP